MSRKWISITDVATAARLQNEVGANRGRETKKGNHGREKQIETKGKTFKKSAQKQEQRKDE